MMKPTASVLVGVAGRLGEVGTVEAALAVDVVGVAGGGDERSFGTGVHRHVDRPSRSRTISVLRVVRSSGALPATVVMPSRSA